jgi:hypothetical protein
LFSNKPVYLLDHLPQCFPLLIVGQALGYGCRLEKAMQQLATTQAVEMVLLFSDLLLPWEISAATGGRFPTVEAFLISMIRIRHIRETRPEARLAKIQYCLLAIYNFTQMNRGRLLMTILARATHRNSIYTLNCI